MIIGQILISVMMFAPLLGVLLSGYPIRDIGWKPVFKGNIKTILLAWLLPSILTAVGAAADFF